MYFSRTKKFTVDSKLELCANKWVQGLEKQLKVNKLRGNCNKWERVKEEHIIFCLRRSAHVQFIPSHGEQGGGCRKEQTIELMQCFDSNNKST